MPMAAGAELRFLRLLGTSHTVGGICKERIEAVCESGSPFLLTFWHLASGRLVNFSWLFLRCTKDETVDGCLVGDFK